ncbi:hypothetical protein HAX54_002281 [Datura stramonium]|uniref:Uncharacterized protein n=1 Tax=Datura stramonium TaxID=4076 RepID=A0ABS8T3M8_DATST|nr:hypothetical protein [Datura stramonium]
MAGKRGRGRPRKSSIALTSLLNFTVSRSRAGVSKEIHGNSSKSQGSDMEQTRAESPTHQLSITPRSSSMVTPASEIHRNILSPRMGTVPLEQDEVTTAEEVRRKIREKDETWMKLFAGNRAAANGSERETDAVSGSSLLNYELPVKNGFTSLSGDDQFSYSPPPAVQQLVMAGFLTVVDYADQRKKG